MAHKGTSWKAQCGFLIFFLTYQSDEDATQVTRISNEMGMLENSFDDIQGKAQAYDSSCSNVISSLASGSDAQAAATGLDEEERETLLNGPENNLLSHLRP